MNSQLAEKEFSAFKTYQLFEVILVILSSEIIVPMVHTCKNGTHLAKTNTGNTARSIFYTLIAATSRKNEPK